MSKGFKASLLAIILLLLILISWPFISIICPGWNCTKDEINIKTGQGRHSRCIAFIRTSSETYDTALSRALKNPVKKTDIKAWHPVNTFCPPSKRYSPHYCFHGALHQARQAELFFESNNVHPKRRTDIAEAILKAWQTAGSDDGAREILTTLWDETEQISNNSIQATPNGAPDG